MDISEQVYQMYQEGISAKDIGEKLDLPEGFVESYFFDEMTRRGEKAADPDSLYHLELGIRIYHALRRSNIKTIADLKQAIELGTIFGIRNLGTKSRQRILDALAESGRLATDVPADMHKRNNLANDLKAAHIKLAKLRECVLEMRKAFHAGTLIGLYADGLLQDMEMYLNGGADD